MIHNSKEWNQLGAHQKMKGKWKCGTYICTMEFYSAGRKNEICREMDECLSGKQGNPDSERQTSRVHSLVNPNP